jgi:hypothetical protein
MEYRADREKRIRAFQAEAMSLVDKGFVRSGASPIDRTNLGKDVEEFCNYLEQVIEIYEMSDSNAEIHRFGIRANNLALKIGLMCQDRRLAHACRIARSEDKIPYVKKEWWSVERMLARELDMRPVERWRKWQRRAKALVEKSGTQPSLSSPRGESNAQRIESSVFLSHSHADNAFARRLANDLKDAGARVWIDEAEIQVGDSLIERIRDGIDAMDYLAVILSPDSVESEWVRREVEIAMNQEIEGKKVKVLPILYKRCNLPGFLKGKFYADFTDQTNYNSALERLRQGLRRGNSGGPLRADLD